VKRFFLIGLTVAASHALAGQITLGVNGFVNGDAEAGPGGNSGPVAFIPGWTVTTGPFTVVQYNSSGGFPSTGDPGVSVGGSNFFAGGPGSVDSSAFQTLDVSNIAAAIDAGSINYTLSGYLGGYLTQNDNAVIEADFLNGANSLISAVPLQGPLAAGRSGLTGLLLESLSGVVPTGTRSVNFVLTMHYAEGQYNDGYADNLSFIATQAGVAPAPEPATSITAGAGLLILIALRKITSSPRPGTGQ
jgi:hypothetical protein